jgi:serine/threonine-protein kinase
MQLEGTTLGGKYRIVRQIGAGGMGRVFEAVHEQTERKVAVKVLSPEAAQQPDTLVRFDREARAAGRIGHDNICEVIDVGFADGNVPYLVMPMLRGHALSAVLRRDGPLPLKRCLDITTQILAALAAAHEAGVIHRDLKPDNVFLVRMGDREDFVKVLDFGISKMLHETRPDATLTQTGTILGTPYYMSPEQARGLKDLDARVDVYAMGTILYQMLTGKPPFDGDSYNQLLSAILLDDFPKPSVRRPETPPAVEDVILQATQKDRQRRYRDAGEMREALLAAVTGTSLKPADLMASSETLPAVSDPPLPLTDPSLGPTSAAPSAPGGRSTAPAIRAAATPTPSPSLRSGTDGSAGGPRGFVATPGPSTSRPAGGPSLAGVGAGDLATGETAVASALSQSRMGQAVLAETAARPPRSRLAGAALVGAAVSAIVVLAVLVLRGNGRNESGVVSAGRSAAAADALVVGTSPAPDGLEEATAKLATAEAGAGVGSVDPGGGAAAADATGSGSDVGPAVSPAADAGPAEEEAGAAEVAAAPAQVRIVLQGVPRGALVRVDGEFHKGATIVRPRGAGEVRIEIQDRGYRPWRRVVPLAEDVELPVRMEPLAARPPRDGGGVRDGGGTGLPVFSEDG